MRWSEKKSVHLTATSRKVEKLNNWKVEKLKMKGE
jgi:hypothetical protein